MTHAQQYMTCTHVTTSRATAAAAWAVSEGEWENNKMGDVRTRNKAAGV